jgi:hypothetical protein
MSYQTLTYEQEDHVVTLTYNRPDQHNAINRAMNLELHHAWQRFRDDDDAFVLVITGAGEAAFCAGWDLQDASELSDPGDFDHFRRDLYNLPGACGYTRKVDIFKPIIAAVNGYAFAAGLETALLADIRIAAENAEFGALERRWNIVGGDGLTARLPLVVGFARAMELIITGRRIDVHEDRRPPAGCDPVRQGDRPAWRRTDPRGKAPHRGGDDPLHVHAPRQAHAGGGRVQGGKLEARLAPSRPLRASRASKPRPTRSGGCPT